MSRHREREVEIRVGTEALHRTIKVQVPEDDPKPWDLDSKLSVVGTDVQRLDAVAKVTGRARYAYDQAPTGLLQGTLLRAPHPKAKVKRVDVSAALAMPGVRAAIATKGPGTDFVQVRFAGDDVAAVAADTLDAAIDALEAIEVDYEVEPFNTDYLAAEGAPRRDAAGQVTDPWPEEAEVEAALAAAAIQHEATYSVAVQTHSSLEPHGFVAWYRDDELEVWASTQATFGVQAGLARALEIEQSKVRVHAEFVGGGFGSKFFAGAEGVAACRLSRDAGAPVKLMLSRYEEHTAAGNRPAALIQIRAGLDAEGHVTAWDFRNWGGPGYIGRGGSAREPAYYLQRAKRRSVQKDLATDTDSSRAMRAPGWPQGFFAAETMLDELAAKAGLDPLELRLKNDSHELRAAEWRLGAERFAWDERRNAAPGSEGGRWRRGAGLASAVWGQMGSPGRTPHKVTCRIHADGTVEARNGAQDIGTGMKTVMAMLTAEELGLRPEQIRVTMGDTRDPAGPASGGSTTTPSLAPAVRGAAVQAKAELAAAVAAHLGAAADDVTFAGGSVGTANRRLSFADAAKLIGPGSIEATAARLPNYDGFQDFVCGCQFAEVEIDTHTGVVAVRHMLAVQDCGRVIAPKLAESQVLGAMIQGISYALHEQRVLDHNVGRMLNGDFLNYKITMVRDMPSLDVVLLPVANGKNSVGAAGLGEPPKVATAAAISNAVHNALGVPVRSLPITPDRVLAALGGGK
ncbi:MAG: xanthine dehydrogenase family protein molybdopterin-binding subunit [Planctomycetota bacterium]